MARSRRPSALETRKFFVFIFLCRCIYKDTSNFFPCLHRLEREYFWQRTKEKAQQPFGGRFVFFFLRKRFECIATEKMSRPLPLNPTFIPPPYGVLRSLLENPLKLPLHHEDGERCPPGCPALGRDDAPGVPFLVRAPPLAGWRIHLPLSVFPGTLTLL